MVISYELIRDILAIFAPLFCMFYVRNADAKISRQAKKEQDLLDRIDQLEETTKTLIEHEHERAARQEELIAMFDLLQGKVESMSDRMDLLSEGVKANLRDRIVQSCTFYLEQQHWIPLSVFENIQRMFVAYKALGGNGVAERLFTEVEQLPMSKPEDC